LAEAGRDGRWQEDRGRDPSDQRGLFIRSAHGQCTEFAGKGTALEIGTDRDVGDGGELEVARDEITHGRFRLSLFRCGIGITPDRINGVGEIRFFQKFGLGTG